MRGSAALVVLIVLAHAALAFFWPTEGVAGARYWSGTALRYLPPLASGALLVAAVTLTLAWLRRAAPRESRGGRVEGKAFLGFALGTAIALLVALPVRYGFLGDNWLRVTEALHGGGNANERGAIAFYAWLVARFADGTGEGAAEVFRNVARVAGLVYAAGWAFLVSHRGVRPGDRRIAVLLALLSGSFLQFAGYLEIYAPLLALLVVLTALALRALDRPWLAWLLPAGAIALAIYHRVALLWVPMALLPLFLQSTARFANRPRRDTHVSRTLMIALTAAALAAGIAVALVLSRETSLFLRLAPEEGRPYALLSPVHLADYANAQWIGSAAGVLLGWSALLSLFASRRAAATIWVAVWAWLLPAAGLFLFNPVLGGADWDVLGLAAPFGILCGVLARGGDRRPADTSSGAGRERNAEQGPRGRGAISAASGPSGARVLAVSLGLSLAIGPAWFLLHRSEASVRWIADLVRSEHADYYQSHPADLHLAFLYGANGLKDAREAALREGRAAHPDDPRFPLGLARSRAAEGRWPEAEDLAMEAYGIVRGYLPALDVLYDVYRGTGRREDQREVGRILIAAWRQDPEGVRPFLADERIGEIEKDLEALASP